MDRKYEISVKVFDDGTLVAMDESDSGDTSGYHRFKTVLTMPMFLGDYVILAVNSVRVPFNIKSYGWDNVRERYSMLVEVAQEMMDIALFYDDESWNYLGKSK